LLKEKMALLIKLIHGYIKYLKESKRGWNEPGSQAISEDQAITLKMMKKMYWQTDDADQSCTIHHSLFTIHTIAIDE